MNHRKTATDIFIGTLGRVSAKSVIPERIRCATDILFVDDLQYPLATVRRIIVVSIGKAATTMCDAILPVLKPALNSARSIEGFVIGTMTPAHPHPQLHYSIGSHPFPDAGSRDAADAVLSLLDTCDETCLVLFLISGGSSAMVEKPLDLSFNAEDVARFHVALVRSGLPIVEMNTLRKHFSAVKGGRLAVAAHRSTQITLIVSDVPESMPHVVGSGPSAPDPSTIKDCHNILAAESMLLALPREVDAYFRGSRLTETPKADHPAFRKSAWITLLSSSDLCRQATELAVAAGFQVVVDNTSDEWDYRDAASYLLHRLDTLHQQYSKVCLLSSGEISVALPVGHGHGGRNQQFALECASKIATGTIPITVLSCGSDGVDGTSHAAGAVCDETTCTRASSLGFDVSTALKNFDSAPLLQAIGDAVIIGPTGNKLRDLRILLTS